MRKILLLVLLCSVVICWSVMVLLRILQKQEINNSKSVNPEKIFVSVIVEKISISRGKYNYFIVTGRDFNGRRHRISTYDLTYNVRDTIRVEFEYDAISTK